MSNCNCVNFIREDVIRIMCIRERRVLGVDRDA